jgi:ferredoxin
MIRLDDWGYPIVDRREVPPQLMALAQRTVTACPVLALKLQAVRRARSA